MNLDLVKKQILNKNSVFSNNEIFDKLLFSTLVNWICTRLSRLFIKFYMAGIVRYYRWLYKIIRNK